MCQTSDIEIIDRVLGGTSSEYARLVDRYKDMAYTLAYRIINNREDAEEIVQDAFINVYRNLKSFKRKSAFSTWLYRIVYNAALSKKRLKKIPVTSFEESGFAEYDNYIVAEKADPLEEKEKVSLLEKVLNALDEEEKAIVMLYYMEESSIDEIYEITGLSKANIKVRLFRARKKMKTMLLEIPGFVYA